MSAECIDKDKDAATIADLRRIRELLEAAEVRAQEEHREIAARNRAALRDR